MSDKRKRIVVKFGTGILTSRTDSSLDLEQFRRLTTELAELVKQGHQCLLVSSGAVGAGLLVLGLPERPKELSLVQACAAVGQTRLMGLYEDLFAPQGFHVAQMLLSHEDIDSRTRFRNARNTLDQLLLFQNVIPVINENDPVAVEELKFGDNDRLSAEVAILAQADLLIILTSVEGLLDESRNLIRQVRNVETVKHLARAEIGAFSTGGMVSKLQAVQVAVNAGIPAVVGSGFKPGFLKHAAAGEAVGTYFFAHHER